jgi:hypothetical protein
MILSSRLALTYKLTKDNQPILYSTLKKLDTKLKGEGQTSRTGGPDKNSHHAQ